VNIVLTPFKSSTVQSRSSSSVFGVKTKFTRREMTICRRNANFETPQGAVQACRRGSVPLLRLVSQPGADVVLAFWNASSERLSV